MQTKRKVSSALLSDVDRKPSPICRLNRIGNKKNAKAIACWVIRKKPLRWKISICWHFPFHTAHITNHRLYRRIRSAARRGEKGIIHDDDIIRKNTMFICPSSIFACLSWAANLFCNVFSSFRRLPSVVGGWDLGDSLSSLQRSRGNTFPMFMYSRFSSFLSPFRGENKLRGSRHTKRKAQRNENNKKNENWTWQVEGKGKLRSNHTPHSIARPDPQTCQPEKPL